MPGDKPRRQPRRTPRAVRGSGKDRGKGPGRTLPAAERPWHKAYDGPGPVPRTTARKQEREETRRAPAAPAAPATPPPAARRQDNRRQDNRRQDSGGELVAGRNPALESLRAQVPASTLYLARGIDADPRVRELTRAAGDRGVAILEVSRTELDRLTGGAVHQGVALQVPPYRYATLPDLLAPAGERSPVRAGAGSRAAGPLLVALDGVTDPRNLGAVIRSAAAFGADGVVVPTRRAAGVTAAAWRTSAGAAAALPVARVPNLTRALVSCQEAGLLVVGLDADGPTGLYDLAPMGDGPLVVVVGSEGRGLSRLVGEACDLRVAIPTRAAMPSLNASVAAAVALAEVARIRATADAGAVD